MHASLPMFCLLSALCNWSWLISTTNLIIINNNGYFLVPILKSSKHLTKTTWRGRREEVRKIYKICQCQTTILSDSIIIHKFLMHWRIVTFVARSQALSLSPPSFSLTHSLSLTHTYTQTNTKRHTTQPPPLPVPNTHTYLCRTN